MSYIDINRKNWDARVPAHLKSDFYDIEGFVAGNCSLKAPELEVLGDITDQRVLHLQCHFGQDSLSLARRGAKVTGVDFSSSAIDAARALATRTQLDAQFIQADVYSAPEVLNQANEFDMVFTTYGTIGWLPDVDRWARVIAHFLKPGGRLIFVEFHPFIWMFDDDFKNIAYRYFCSEAIVEELEGTYADKSAPIQSESVSWNHGLAEVFTAISTSGLTVKDFCEFDYSPWNCLNDMIEDEPGCFRLHHWRNRVPMCYRLVCTKL